MSDISSSSNLSLEEANILITEFMNKNKLMVLSSIDSNNSNQPSSALVGFATDIDDITHHGFIMDTLTITRKYANMTKNPHVSCVLLDKEGEQTQKTIQINGFAKELKEDNAENTRLKEIYWKRTGDGRKNWENICYFHITPTWLRYTDFAHMVQGKPAKFEIQYK